MIEVLDLCKKFDDFFAVNGLNLSIPEGSVFALTGANGAGKSTFMKMLTGIVRPTSGDITIDGEAVYENTGLKRRFFYIPDDQYFLRHLDPAGIAAFYAGIYPRFDAAGALELCGLFGLPSNRRADAFSKGMKKLLSVAFALSAGTDYIFCDETFDGIDPLMRETVKELVAKEMNLRPLTLVINSHNLRELEGFCTHAALIHGGKLITDGPIDDRTCLENMYLQGMRSLGIDAGKAVLGSCG